MITGKPFSIGVWPGGKPDDMLTGEKLIALGFAEVPPGFYKNGFTWYPVSGDLAYNGKTIICGMRSLSQLAGMYYQISGSQL